MDGGPGKKGCDNGQGDKICTSYGKYPGNGGSLVGQGGGVTCTTLGDIYVNKKNFFTLEKILHTQSLMRLKSFFKSSQS